MYPNPKLKIIFIFPPTPDPRINFKMISNIYLNLYIYNLKLTHKLNTFLILSTLELYPFIHTHHLIIIFSIIHYYRQYLIYTQNLKS